MVENKTDLKDLKPHVTRSHVRRAPMASPRSGVVHIEAAKPIIMTGLWIAGIVGFACVLGGIVAIYRNALSPSEVGLLDSKLTTGHVGVAFVFIGVVVLGVVIRKAYRTVVQLGEIPN